MAGARGEPPYSYFQDLKYGSSVAVNQRALVEKALARYSTKYAAFRELISNAADAAATRVKIQIKTSLNTQFESDVSPKPFLDDVRPQNVLREVVVQNNGNFFGADDWNRLTSIGQGNPSSDTIGMFGLGFYSVFELTDEPIVVSGAEALAFRWKGDMLHHEHVRLSPDQSIQETQVILKCKDTTTKTPNLIELGQFLACSLAFVQLSSIELWVDDRMILSVSKEIEYSPVELSTQIKTETEHMRIDTIEQGTIRMRATWLDGMYDGAEPSQVLPIQPLVTRVNVFSRGFPNLDSPTMEPQKPTSTKNDQHRVRLSAFGHSEGRSFVRSLDARIRHSFHNHSLNPSAREGPPVREQFYGTERSERESYAIIRVPIIRANVSTQIHGQLALGMEAVTRKEAPGTVSVSIVTPCKDSSHLCPLFDLIMPSDSEAGSIFNGFPTLQSTGLEAHILIPAILDMHRGLVDLKTKHVKVWNEELLQVAGILSRVVWTQEMKAIKASSLSPLDLVVQRKGSILGRKKSQLSGPMRSFTLFNFQTSAPDPEVGRVVQDSFWTACKSIDIVSTQGVRNSTDVRIEDRGTAGFMNNVPLLPRYIAEKFRGFVTSLQSRNLISNVNTTDIQYELSRNVLNKRQFSCLLEWGFSTNTEALESVRNIIKAATIKLPGRPNLALKDVKYVTEHDIPKELLPEIAIAHADIGDHVSGAQLRTIGWDPLPVVDWLRLSESRLRTVKDPATAEKVLTIVSSKLKADEYGKVLKCLPKIPTDGGLITPEEAYFPLKKPFENLGNLPYVKEMPGVRKALLKRMGVRTEVKMNVIVEHLQSVHGDLSKLKEYVSYLINIHQPVSEEDREVLSTARVWYAETPDQNGHREDAKYTLSELFEPSPRLRVLQVPTLYLPQTYQKDSPMGSLFRLSGLKTHPSVPELLDVLEEAISHGEDARREFALRYLIDNFTNNNYQTYDFANSAVKFLPIHGDSTRHVAPNECFTNKQVASLGFHKLAEQFTLNAADLGVKSDPPVEDCVDRLVTNPPATAKAAADIFEYLWSIRDHLEPYLNRLASAKFVPVFTRQIQDDFTDAVDCEVQDNPRFVQPNECYTGPFNDEFEELAGLFEYVRVERGAWFLRHCGAQATPSADMIADKFTTSPGSVLSALQTSGVYVKWFAWLGDHHKKHPLKMEAMRKSAFIPTIRNCKGQMIFELVTSDMAVVYDDFRLFELFREALHLVPQRDDVESFCLALGCKKLSIAVHTECMPGPRVDFDVGALRTRLLEQLRFFLDCLDVDHVGLSWEELKDDLVICSVEQINMRWRYQGIVKYGQTAAFAERVAARCTLWIVPGKFEACDLSRELARLILKSPKPVDFLTLETILQSSLNVLKTRGYGIERILREEIPITQDPVYQAETQESHQIITAPSDTKEGSGSITEHCEALSRPSYCEEKAPNTRREEPYPSSVGADIGHYMCNEQSSSHWTEVPNYDRQELYDVLPRGAPRSDSDFLNMKNWTTFSAPSSTMFVAKETHELRYFGELYISQLLSSRLAQGCYKPDEHWTSPMRSRNGHTPFPASVRKDDSSAFTIVPGNGELRQEYVRACGIDDSMLDQRCTFHIEVCTTNMDLHAPFRLSNTQHEKARSMSLGSTTTTTKDVFILARVYKVKHNPGIALYADPWRLHLRGLISLDATSTYRVSISKKAPAMLEEMSPNEDLSVATDAIYKGLGLTLHTFRLIRLHYEADDEAPLRCRLNRFSVDGDHGFTAISYVWGPPPSSLSPYRLEVNGITIPITESLWTCLRRLRRDPDRSLLWVDAVCIDQRNDVEKGMQVRRMGSLYGRAKKVIVWTGDERDDDGRAIRVLADMARTPGDASGPLPGADIDAFLQRPWFTRTWTIQELVFGAHVEVVSGNAVIKWEDMIKGIRVYMAYAQSNPAQGRKNSRYILHNLGPALTLDYIRGLYHGTEPSYPSQRQKPSFLEILDLFFYTQSTRSRDKLFALINLAHDTHDEETFTPDYASSNDTVLSAYATQLVNSGAALALLYRAGRPKGSSFCSWIPDLMNARGTTSYAPTISTWAAGEESGFCAGEPCDAGARIAAHSVQQDRGGQRIPVLSLRGKFVDKVKSVRPLKISTDASIIRFCDAVEDLRAYIAPMTEALSEECKNEQLMRFFVGDAAGPQLKSLLIPEPLEKNRAETWPPGIVEEVLGAKPGLDGRALLNKSADAQHHIHAFWQTASHFLGRIPRATACITRRNLVGIVPGQARGGDRIFVPSGAKVPILVRECEGLQTNADKNGNSIKRRKYYTLVGECYVDRIMYFQSSLARDIPDSRIYLA